MPDMKKLVVGDKEFDIVDAAAQDHLLEHDQQIEQILGNSIVNKNMLINSDFIMNFNPSGSDGDLNLSGWTIPEGISIIPSQGLMIPVGQSDVKLHTPSWHPSWNSTSAGDSVIGYPVTVSMEYVLGNLTSLDDIKTASATFNSPTSSLTDNLFEVEEGIYLQVNLMGETGGATDGTQSTFLLTDTLTVKPLWIRRIKIERSEMATGFDHSMNDLALLKVAKEMIDTKQQIYSVTPSNQTVTPGSFVTLATLTVPKGVYVVNGFHEWTEGFAEYYIDRIGTNYDRNLLGRAGGGHSISCIINVTAPTAILEYFTYLEGSTNRTAKTISLQAVKIM